MALRSATLLVALVAFASPALGFSGSGTFSGGSSGSWACNGKVAPASGLPLVAINPVQFAGGATCGQCISVAGTGTGAGKQPIWTTPQVRTVAGIMSQGNQGDLDFPSGGDGKWNINWSFVACPGGSPNTASNTGQGGQSASGENPNQNLVHASAVSRKML